MSAASSRPTGRTTALDSGARRIVLFASGTVAVVVLLFGYRTSTSGAGVPVGTVAVRAPGAGPGTAGPAGPGAGAGTGAGGAGAGTGAGGAGAGTGAGAAAGKTYTGGVAQTRWGPVQVAITVSAGKITAADAVVVPNGNRRDVQINSYAVPVLNSEAVQAQSAKIDTVSGATVTSDGYLASLQSALNAAGM